MRIFNILREIKVILENYELVFKLAAKEIKIRYKHPMLGFLWALIVPLSMVLIFKIIFSDLLKISLVRYPFFIFLTTAVFPWNFFSLSVTNSVMSIQENSSLIKKVYFPRQIIPISIIVANLINFLLTLLVIFPIFAFFQIKLSNFVIFLPSVILLEAILTIGISLIFSGLQAQFRDVKYFVEILLFLWFYLTPIFYPLDLISDIGQKYFKIYMLNPLAQIITLYRLCFLEGYVASLPAGLTIPHLIFLTLSSSFIIFFFGFWIFKRFEPRFADLV